MSLAWESRNATESGFTYAIITASEDSSTLTPAIASNLLQDANSYNGSVMTIKEFIEGEQVDNIQFGLKIVGFTKIEGGAFGDRYSFAMSNMGKIKLDPVAHPTLTTIGEMILTAVPVTTIEIPSSVTSIDPLAFSDTSIDNIIVDNNNPNYSTGNVIAHFGLASGVLYNKAGTELLIYPPNKGIGSITIPEEVTTIGEKAFHNNTTIASVTLASTITTIKLRAFTGTTSLNTLNLKSTMTIGDYAFEESAIAEIVAVALTIDDRSQKTTNETTITYNPPSPADPTTETKIYDITSTVAKDEKTVTYIWQETVSAVSNSAPTFTSIPVTSATEDVAYTYTVTTNDVDVDDTVTVTATTKPDWLSFDGTTLSGTPSNSDVGDNNVVLTATDSNSATAEQTFTITVINVNDSPSGSVTISGTAAQNETLTASNNIADEDGLGDFSYQWKRNGTDISGATSSTYTLIQDDVGNQITVTVTYTDDQGTTETLTSEPTSAVANVNDNPTGSVTIDGVTTENTILTAVTSSIGDVDGLGDFTYQWKRDGSDISGETSSTYTLVQADVGNEITVTVTYTDGQGTTENVTSAPTSAVANVNDDPTGSVTISGTAAQNETLTAITTTIGDVDGLGDFTYQWKRDGSDITGATNSTYTLTNDDVGKKISVTVTYTDGGNTPESLTSEPTSAVTNVNDSPTGSVTISGTAAQNQTLTAITTTIGDVDGLGDFTYQWKRDGSDISGETSSTYTLVQADVGKKITVTVTYTDNQETVESLTSTETSAVLNKEPFKPKTKTELQTAIDKWYELANGSAGTTSTSETSNETDKKSKFYLKDDTNPIELDIQGKLDSDEYLDAKKGITKANLVKVVIGTDVKSIGAVAFQNCKALKTVIIPDSVTSIGAVAFAGCKALKTVIIPDSVTSIGGQAFQMCDALTSVIIPDSVTIIDGQTFQHCTALTTVIIPDSVTSIGNAVFLYCKKLKTVTIGTSVETIGINAFFECRDLTTLTIPDSVTTIGSDAFGNSGLITLYMSENNGLNLKEGDQKVSGKNVKVVFIPSNNPNNYDGPEYYGNPNTWDTSLITDLSFLFYEKTQENHPDISTWNVFNVTNMQGTFSNSTFNGELNKWNVENVTDFSYCFANNVVFNQPLSRWNTQDATTLKYMFYNAWSFNQTINRAVQYSAIDKIFPTYPNPQNGTKIDWTEDEINNYLTTIYGSALPASNPTTFKGAFGMMALGLKIIAEKKLSNTSLNRAQSELVMLCNNIKLYNETYNSETTKWTKVTGVNTDYAKEMANPPNTDTDLTRHKLNNTRLTTIINAMLQINKANDYIQESDLNDYKTISKTLYTDMRSTIPFYLAWDTPKTETKAHMKHNALTFINGNKGTMNTTLSGIIDTNPVRILLEQSPESYNNGDKTKNITYLGETLDTNLKTTLKTP